jgi:dTDP-4-dehydrorhamnose 3,5-epimerase
VTSEAALFHYKCTAPYHPAGERTIRWDDPELGVVWPLPEPVVSAKDAAGKRMQEAPADWWFA